MADYIIPVLFLFLVAVVAASVFWSTTPTRRASAYCGVIALLAMLWQTCAGTPRMVIEHFPSSLGMPNHGQLLGFIPDEPKAIYILETNGENSTKPLLLQLPWDEKLAAKLADLMTQAGANPGTAILLNHGLAEGAPNDSQGDAGIFNAYLRPPAAPPPKQTPAASAAPTNSPDHPTAAVPVTAPDPELPGASEGVESER